MTKNHDSFLLVNHDSVTCRHLVGNWNGPPLVIAGTDTGFMMNLLIDNRICDYSYCDFSNEISVCELANYLYKNHRILGVLLYQHHYKFVRPHQKWIYDSLHRNRLLYRCTQDGFETTVLESPHQENHLTCNSSLTDLAWEMALRDL